MTDDGTTVAYRHYLEHYKYEFEVAFNVTSTQLFGILAQYILYIPTTPELHVLIYICVYIASLLSDFV